MTVDTVLTLSSPAATETATSFSPEQFDEIVRQHQQRVYRMLFLLLRDADAADTLTQECFLRLRGWRPFSLVLNFDLISNSCEELPRKRK